MSSIYAILTKHQQKVKDPNWNAYKPLWTNLKTNIQDWTPNQPTDPTVKNTDGLTKTKWIYKKTVRLVYSYLKARIKRKYG